MPLLADLAEQGAGQLDVVGVLTQDTPINGLAFARHFKMNYTSVLDDDGGVMRRFSPGPPVTLFLSAQGELRHVTRGEFKDATELRQLVRSISGSSWQGLSSCQADGRRRSARREPTNM